MNRADLLARFGDTAIYINGGHIRLVDVMGDEQSIVDAARVSYGAGTSRKLEDVALLRYLMRHDHWTPFEMCELKIRIRIPMDAWRQMVRHRTASINEYSTRYSIAIEEMATTEPEEWRKQSTDNKQGSAGYVYEWPEGTTEEPTDGCPNGAWVNGQYFASPGDYLSAVEADFQERAGEIYKERLSFGVAREQARKDLPLSTYTEAYWKIDLRNLLHFLALRLHPHAQKEIREYAEALATIVKEWVPNVWEAFEDYKLDSVTLTGLELPILELLFARDEAVLKHLEYLKWLKREEGIITFKSRELLEFEKKVELIGIPVMWETGPIKKG